MSTTAMTNDQTTYVNMSGGAAICQDVNIDGGDFVNRDKHEHHHYYSSTPPSPTTTTANARGIFGLYPFNQNFFGRDEELATLHSLLQAQTNVAICPIITGMGGLGKTQLAAHYARNHVDGYPAGIFWITAANLNDIRPQLADFCVALGLPVADPQRSGDLTEQKITAFKAYLDSHPHTLLIFDNVAEPDHLRTRQIGVQLTALTLGGKVIITTRRRKLPDDKFAELALQRLLPEAARQILMAVRADLVNDPDIDPLCAQFGYLPLMLNLAAAALKKRGGAIAGYLQRLQTLGAEKLHSEVAKVSLDDYHKSLTAVLQEQWTMLRDENARLLLRVAGQLPEAAVIPTARLGLLAGLADVDEWERPLGDAVDELESASLIEHVDNVTARLHPLVRDFAVDLLNSTEQNDFCQACARNLARQYENLAILELHWRNRGMAAVIVDLLTARQLLMPSKVIITALQLIPNQSDATDRQLYTLLRILRRESHNLQDQAVFSSAACFLQQFLYRAWTLGETALVEQSAQLLTDRREIYLRPIWAARRESSHLEQTLVGHADSVNSVCMLDTERIISVSSDRTLKIWNLITGQLEQTFIGHELGVTAVSVLDTYRIVSASNDHTLKVWNLITGQPEQTLIYHTDSVIALSVLDTERIISASQDGTLKVWNLITGQSEQTFVDRVGSVTSMSVLDTHRIVSASHNGTLKIWNLVTGQLEQTLFSYTGWITAVSVLDAERIVSASQDGTLKIWNLANNQLDQTLVAHADWVTAVSVINGNRIVSAANDDTIKVWNLDSGQLEQTLIGHTGWITAVSVLDSERIVSASQDGTIKIWNLTNDQFEETLASHTGWVTAVSVLDSERIVSASQDGTIKIWNLGSGQLEQTLVGHTADVTAISVLDTQRIVSVSSDRTFKIWNLTTGQLEQTLTGHADWVYAVNVLDSERIVSAAQDGTLKVWNLASGLVEKTLIGHVDSVYAVSVLDSERIISAAQDGTLKVWNLASGLVEQTLIGHRNRVIAVDVLDAERIVSSSDDHTLKVWNLASGLVEQTLVSHVAGVNTVSVLDTKYIVSASSDRTVKVWHLDSGKVIASLGLDSALWSVAVLRQKSQVLVVAGDAAGALYCLGLVEPVGLEEKPGQTAGFTRKRR